MCTVSFLLRYIFPLGDVETWERSWSINVGGKIRCSAVETKSVGSGVYRVSWVVIANRMGIEASWLEASVTVVRGNINSGADRQASAIYHNVFPGVLVGIADTQQPIKILQMSLVLTKSSKGPRHCNNCFIGPPPRLLLLQSVIIVLLSLLLVLFSCGASWNLDEII